HYRGVTSQLRRLDAIVEAAAHETTSRTPHAAPVDASARTAIVLVNGYNGLGLHTALHVPRVFGDTFRNFAFLAVGAVDAGNFKGAAELDALQMQVTDDASHYARWARAHGYGAKTYTAIGHDVAGEIMRLAHQARAEFTNS